MTQKMIEHIQQDKTENTNILAINIHGGFTTADMDFFAQAFAEKLAQGHKKVNILLTMDQLTMRNSSILAGIQERLWVMKNLKQYGKVALLTNKKQLWLKLPVQLETLLVNTLNIGIKQKHFCIRDLDKAMAFVSG